MISDCFVSHANNPSRVIDFPFVRLPPGRTLPLHGLRGAFPFAGRSWRRRPPGPDDIDRISVIGDPNALLFGMGSPAGISDSGLNRALLNRTRGEARFRLDGESSKRASVDLNQPLIRDRLALRVDGVRDRREYWLKPGAYRNDRFYLALTAKPTHTTSMSRFKPMSPTPRSATRSAPSPCPADRPPPSPTWTIRTTARRNSPGTPCCDMK